MRMTVRDMQEMKDTNQRIPVLTAYDYAWAKLLEAAGVRFMLVGDSLGQCVLGYETTVPVTMDDMLHHVRSVVRGTDFAHVIADMPFMSYQVDDREALRNAGRLLAEGGAQSVKLEGGRRVASTVRRLTEAGVPVMGHIGLTPQSINQIGRPRVQGNSPEAASALVEDAVALQEAGAYSIVLESVPARLAKVITERLTIPTIGIGAGPHCDGQVQVSHDILGLLAVGIHIDHVPRHVRRYAQLSDTIISAVSQYAEDIREGRFPSDEESFKMKRGLLDEIPEQSAVPPPLPQ